jgi:hypothetical protein
MVVLGTEFRVDTDFSGFFGMLGEVPLGNISQSI